MPKYYFHIRSGDSLFEDDEGLELPDLESARLEASEGAREILAERLRTHADFGNDVIEIADGGGRLLAIVPMRDVLP